MEELANYDNQNFEVKPDNFESNKKWSKNK